MFSSSGPGVCTTTVSRAPISESRRIEMDIGCDSWRERPAIVSAWLEVVDPDLADLVVDGLQPADFAAHRAQSVELDEAARAFRGTVRNGVAQRHQRTAVIRFVQHRP